MKKYFSFFSAYSFIFLFVLLSSIAVATPKPVFAKQSIAHNVFAADNTPCPPDDESCVPPNSGTGTGAGTTNTNNGGSSSGLECPPGTQPQNGLCIPKSTFQQNCSNSSLSLVCADTAGKLAFVITRILLIFSGVVAVLFIIIGGFQYMTSAGNTETAIKGQRTVTNAIIGLVIIILSYVIVSAVVNSVVGGNLVGGGGGGTVTTRP